MDDCEASPERQEQTQFNLSNIESEKVAEKPKQKQSEQTAVPQLSFNGIGFSFNNEPRLNQLTLA